MPYDGPIAVARTNNSFQPNDHKWVIPNGALDLPPLRLAALRVITPIEGDIQFSSAQPIQLLDIAPQFRARRYCQQLWIYAFKGWTGGTPSLPVANADTAYWGWSPSSMINFLFPFAGGYSGLIAPPDGLIFDISQIWFAGIATDGLHLLAY